MSTLVVSDLHLGARSRADVARRADLRAPLLEVIADADELVLLGDVVELRDGPLAPVLEEARGFFEDVGRALGSGRVLLVPGNHDHELIAPWIEERRASGERLSAAERVSPAAASPSAAQLAEWLGPAELEVSYPGAWLRDDVYATHGHYVDLHISVPSFERLAARAVDRVVRGSGAQVAGADDYEAALRPIYALLDEVAQVAPDRGPGGAGVSERAWRLLVGDARRRVSLPARLAGRLAWPLAIAALDRAGLGPLSSDLSGRAMRSAAVAAMGEVLHRLGVQAEHAIFGHTHRAGPLQPRDDPRDWVTASGTRLVNSGCWLYSRTFLTGAPNESPYWPGTCVRVGADGPPELDRLLGDRTHADLQPR